MYKKKLSIHRAVVLFFVTMLLMLAVCPTPYLAAKKKTTKTTKKTTTAVNYAPAQVKSLKATAGENKAVLKWKKVTNASGYYVYQVDVASGKRTKVKTIKKGSTVSVTLSKLKNNEKYTYVVSAYRTKNKKTYEGAVSAKVTVTPRIDPPNAPVLKVYANNDGKVTLSWSKIKKSSGVEIYQKNTEGKFEKIGTTTSTAITIKGLENGKIYQFKARSFRRVGSEYGYSAFSNTVEGKPFAPNKNISNVMTAYVNVTVKKSGNYQLASGKGTAYVSTGDKLTSTTIYNAEKSSQYFTCTRTSDGKQFKIRQSDLKGASTLVTTRKTVYSNSVAESYVNFKGYSSRDQYLIWVNLYTQRVYVFKGSQYNWKVLHNWKCSSGTGKTQTLRSVTTIRSKRPTMDFEGQLAYHVSYFNKGLAFHSWLYNYVNGNWQVDASVNWIGQPLSHGCVRLSSANATWVYNNTSSWKTTVVVY